MKQQIQEAKIYSFNLVAIRNEEIAAKVADTLRDIDVIVDKLQVNILGFKNMFMADVRNKMSTITVGSIKRIIVDPVHNEQVSVEVAVTNKDIIDTLDRELEIDPDNYKVEISFDNSGETLKVLTFRLNTQANINARRKQKQQKRGNGQPKGKRKFDSRTSK